MESNKMNKYTKVSTSIDGLDQILYDGLDLSRDHTLIIIRGGEYTEKTLLGLQMMYGIAQGLNNNESPVIPCFYTNHYSCEYINDLLLDIIITKCIQLMTMLHVSNHNTELFQDNLFSHLFFKIPDNQNCNYQLQEIDNLICQEAVYYSNRTNALHYRRTENYTHNENFIVERRGKGISDYFNKDLGDIQDRQIDKLKKLSNRLKYPLISSNVENLYDKSITDLKNEINSHDCNNKKNTVACYDLIFPFTEDLSHVAELLDCINQKHTVALVVVPDNIPLSNSCADMIIDLTNKDVEHYTLQYLCITRCIFQLTAKGWHQYKRRDYGIEIFPSINTYFPKRRYLQRALVYTHSDVVTDTYQQYLDSLGVSKYHSGTYREYTENKERRKKEYIDDLLSPEISYNTSIDILEKILLSQGEDSGMQNKDGIPLMRRRDCIKLFRGGVTAIIGEANTYKRFITFGSIFSSSLQYEHSLILLLNKDTSMTRRRLSCPAMMHSGTCRNEKCAQCYSYIHFMNIFMGNITSDEFIYFLRKQVSIPFTDGRRISRVIIDDLQILDFCFPLLKNNPLFIPSLAALCHELDIDLYILCDREAEATYKLRAIADNVLCTERDTDGTLLLYIERFAGYDNTPSKIYCGKIKRPREIFECYDIYEENGQIIRQYGINDEHIEDHPVVSMNDFWHGENKSFFGKTKK
ncbi:MAG: hypothetical protein K2N13_09330 [Paraprevotella sp.]|nr:hypothetical protein [Paraprevotella sp.]